MSSPEVHTGDEPVAKRVADAVLAVPGVVGLDGGLFGEVATYLPGERVSGVQFSDDEGSVHIVVDLRHDLRQVAAEVADVVAAMCELPVSVTIEDVTAPATAEADETPGESDE